MKPSSKTIFIAKDFSRFPAGRFITDGKFSGECFRNDFLLPALTTSEKVVVINLNGVLGYGSSWLAEAFNGKYLSDKEKNKLSFVSQDLSLIMEIKEYLYRV